VPYFVLRRRDMPFNGQNATLLYAYGGFQVSNTPAYSPNVGKLWLDRGGVYVMANIRGGGEFGPPGTKRACARSAKSSTTISTPWSAISLSAASPARAVSASWAARTAAC
jgi:prolyl oligopeptidase PreP (S9A serine peptidase family)